jgi:hypothetical protein
MSTEQAQWRAFCSGSLPRRVSMIRTQMSSGVCSRKYVCFLASGIPSFASDEHLSSTQLNDWSRHESA